MMTEGQDMTDQPEKLDPRSHDIAEDKRQELLRLFPEVRTESGKLDFERLKRALGEAVDAGKERYGMNWPGKADCFKAIQTPSLGTLRPCPEESVHFDTTENLIIEGDNLEVLKLLQKSYLGKVKMIYIDPPYNTGNDFIYPDNYSESLQTYLEYTGQVDAEGKKFSTNTEADGRFHSKWLNMMYPRLYLARNLLTSNGIVFISIDDGEVENLRRLCNEIFGEEVFVAQFVWKSRVSEDTRAKTGVSTDHEYIVCYRASDSQALRGSQKDLSKFANPDNDPRGPWRSADLTGLAAKEARPNLHYDLVDPATGVSYGCPPKGWRFDPNTMEAKIAEGRILWPASADGRPRHKLFLNEMESQFKNLSSVLLDANTAQGTRELIELFGEDVIPFPKPSSLLRLLVEQATEADDVVLDFFAGSGTTAHAVLDVNKQDGGNRRFILVQLPEPTGRENFPTIADITKERVRRVIKKLNDEDAGKLDLDIAKKQDRGFRVFKLAESNFKPWNAEVPHDAAALERQLELHVDHIREGRTAEDLLYEVLLKSGFPLTTPVETLTLAGKTVHSVAGGALFICLERELTLELVRATAERKPERVVCLDEGFAGNDQLKANAVQIFKTKGVTSFKTV
ncbi:MAG: site-specific DNA-methyltransferase [bacterium]